MAPSRRFAPAAGHRALDRFQLRRRTLAVDLSTEDRLAIYDLYARYAWALDSGDIDSYAALFTEHGRFGDKVGRDVIRDYVAQLTGAADWAGTQHFNNQIVFLDGDATRCTLKAYCAITRRGSDGETRLRRSGTYRDVCVKVDGTWLFEARVYKDMNSE